VCVSFCVLSLWLPLLDGGSCSIFEDSSQKVGVVVEFIIDRNLAVRSGFADGLADTAFVGFFELGALHRQWGGLSGEEGDQRCHAFFITPAEPHGLISDGDLAQRLDGAISERLEELEPLLCTGECELDDKYLEATATGGGLSSKFKELVSGGISQSGRLSDLEVFEVWALVQELLQWPLLEAVMVIEAFDCELLQALLFVDRTTKYVDECVDHVCGGAPEVSEVDFGGRLQVGGESIPAHDRVLGPHAPSIVNLNTIELDGAFLDIHRLRARGIGLERQRQEWLIVDEEDELVPVHNVL